MEEIDGSVGLLTLHPDTRTFLEFLGGGVECTMFMKEGSKEVLLGFGTKFYTTEEFEAQCRILWEAHIPFEPHLTLNLTNLKGRKKSDIVGTRVLCVDLDEPLPQGRLNEIIEMLQPHLVVSSSPGKYHLYWRCSLSLTDWQLAQGALALKLGGDLNFIDIHKTIRIPGFARVCKDGSTYTPCIVYEAKGEDVCELDETMRLLGNEAIAARKARDKELSKKANKVIDTMGRTGHVAPGDIKDIGAGERNSSLYQICKGFVIKGNGTVTEESTVSFALQVNSEFEAPLGEDEAIKTAVSAYKAGEEVKAKKQAKAEETKEATREAMRHHSETIGAIAETNGGAFNYSYETPMLKINRFSDKALVERVLQRYNGHIVRTGKIVYAFDEIFKVWRPQRDSKELIHTYVDQCCVDTLNDEQFIAHQCGAGENAGAKLKKAQAEWLSNSKSFSCVSKLVQRPDLPRMNIGDFDSDNYKFYCANGALNLITGEIKEATALDYLLRQSSVRYEEGATCPYFEAFLEEVFSENRSPEEMIMFLQEVFGYTLTGSTNEQVLFIHHGEGSNGKSIILSALDYLAGEYATMMQPTALAKNKNAIANELNRIGAKIEGKRAVIIDDLDTKTQWNEGIVKNLTGDKILARNLYEEEKDIPNRSKMHIGCNMLPDVEASNHAIHRRIVVLRYEKRFDVNGAKKKEIQDNIKKELSGILNWAMEGLRRIIERDPAIIEYPEEVKCAIDDYEEESSINKLDLKKLLINLLDFSDNDDEYMALGDIYKALLARNPSAREVSPSALGIVIKRDLGAKSRRIEVKGKKVTLYYVKLKAETLV